MEEIYSRIIFLIFRNTKLRPQLTRNYARNYVNNSHRSGHKDFKNFIKNSCKLPPPPDVRKVLLKNNADIRKPIQTTRQDVTEQQLQVAHQLLLVINIQRLCISNLNTTLIGDYISVAFPEYHQKWLVQAFGNATFQSTLDFIILEKILVNRRYIFLQLGGNQLRSSNKQSVFKNLLSVILAV